MFYTGRVRHVDTVIDPWKHTMQDPKGKHPTGSGDRRRGEVWVRTIITVSMGKARLPMQV